MALTRDEVKAAIKSLPIELPSWGFGDAGTRFGAFPEPGAARDIYEKIEDASTVHRLTGASPSVAVHIPWDLPPKGKDWADMAAFAREQGVAIGAINPNLFQDHDYKLGSVCHADPQVRAKAVAHLVECAEIAGVTGSKQVSVWLADGTNYPGQDDIRSRRSRLIESLSAGYAALPAGVEMLVEYKLFEPAFYTTDLCDWGTSFAVCQRLGERAKVLVDTGHHGHYTNIEFIVATLLDEGRLGGFHFNDRRYADDDLIVGSANPFQLFLIFHELINGNDGRVAAPVAYMLDQCHVIESKIEAMVLSVLNVQTAYAKALLVDRDALKERQAAGDVLGAHAILRDAYETDVRPILCETRQEIGRPADPLAALKTDGLAIERREARQKTPPRASGGGLGA
ncbi:MAG TPA: L-rhamnose isomerase [Armatimonadaceae bacterium]|nr:L-rhamnose isomerase [Armatimonadaceae bacterium]